MHIKGDLTGVLFGEDMYKVTGNEAYRLNYAADLGEARLAAIALRGLRWRQHYLDRTSMGSSFVAGDKLYVLMSFVAGDKLYVLMSMAREFDWKGEVMCKGGKYYAKVYDKAAHSPNKDTECFSILDEALDYVEQAAEDPA